MTKPPTTSERHRQLIQLVRLHQAIRVSDAADTLGVHEMTIRRDLNELAKQGLLTRTHGGAQLAGLEEPFLTRLQQHPAAKERIAKAALRFINASNTIAFDASTTALALARRLTGLEVSAIATNLGTANVLAEVGIPFTLIGGQFHDRSRSFVGTLAQELLQRFRPDLLFFSAKGFSAEAGFTDNFLPEAGVKEQLIASARYVIALLDSSKFGQAALYRFALPQAVDVLISEASPPAAIREVLTRHNIELIVAEE